MADEHAGPANERPDFLADLAGEEPHGPEHGDIEEPGHFQIRQEHGLIGLHGPALDQADAAEAFREAPGGFYDPEVSEKLVQHLFAPRNSIDPAEAYRMFRGRDARMEALMRDRGFPVPDDVVR